MSSDSDGDGENGGDRSHLEGSSQRVLQNLIAQWNKREEREKVKVIVDCRVKKGASQLSGGGGIFAFFPIGKVGCLSEVVVWEFCLFMYLKSVAPCLELQQFFNFAKKQFT